MIDEGQFADLYCAGGGRFADECGSESRRRVEQCATDAWLLLETNELRRRKRTGYLPVLPHTVSPQAAGN
jgi:hypothetical protein